ncbi:hypothetical protein DH2020_038847 [Rehmannia glutinosa]|uniref:Autophagy-related protein 18a n=1 Tax=Rehmannia glutinosa TaxID=99300 RepID=A0ABR0UXG0_REHGL
MATISSFSSLPDSNPNSNPNFFSPMLQPYLEQQQQRIQPDPPPPDDGTAEESVPDNDSRDSTTTTNNNSTVPNLIQTLAQSSSSTSRSTRTTAVSPPAPTAVGGGDSPQYPLNKVMIWDDHQSRCIGELSFRSEVRGVRLRRDRIIVVLEQKIFVYNFADLKLLHQIETIANPKGLCAVSQVAGSFVLVCPGLQKGQVRVEHYASKRTKFIMAHDSRIASFTLSQDGNLLATASSKGTLVRIYNTHDGSLLQEVRRGADRAEIYSLAFSPTAQWLAVSSDKGTVHVFGLKVNSGNVGKERSNSPDPNPSATSSSSLSFIKGVLPKYFSSEWSVAQFRLPEGSQYIVAFGHQKNTVVILGLDGSFYRCKFDPATGGEMTQLEYHNFLKPEDAF